MKILILQDYLRGGGTERQSVHLARRFHAEGSEVKLLTFRPDGPLAHDLAGSGVPHLALQPLDTGMNFFAPGLLRRLRRSQSDVILCMGLMANCYAGLIQRCFPKTAVVCSVRTGKPITPVYAWSLRQVSGVVTNTEWWRPKLIELGIAPERIAVIANGTTRDWPLAKQEALRQRTRSALGIEENTVVFLNVAEFRRDKRQARLIEFFAGVDPNWNWRLFLVGGGKEWQRCQRMAERLEPRRIQLTGYEPDPFPWYCAADVCVSASQEDSLPNFLVEAQSLGLPVIATDFKGVGEALRHGETGFLVPPHDPQAFHAAVKDLFRDTERRSRMSQQARELAAERHASPTQANLTFEALNFFRSIHVEARPTHA